MLFKGLERNKVAALIAAATHAHTSPVSRMAVRGRRCGYDHRMIVQWGIPHWIADLCDILCPALRISQGIAPENIFPPSVSLESMAGVWQMQFLSALPVGDFEGAIASAMRSMLISLNMGEAKAKSEIQPLIGEKYLRMPNQEAASFRHITLCHISQAKHKVKTK